MLSAERGESGCVESPFTGGKAHVRRIRRVVGVVLVKVLVEELLELFGR